MPGKVQKASVDFDAVIYGAGPVGAAVALGLQQHGHRVCVREKRTEHQVVIDAGKSINLSLSTRGRALLTDLGVWGDLESTLIPMVSRRFADGSTERYREPLLSINRNLLTIKLIEAAAAAGVAFEYGTGYTPGDVDAVTGEVRLGEGRRCKPRVVVGCDGVHGKLCKLINPAEPARSSRASEWGYYELSLPPAATAAMSVDVFRNFHIWSGRGRHGTDFIVGLPNHDGSITLTLFALTAEMAGRFSAGEGEGGADHFRSYLREAFDGGLDALAEGIDEAVAGGFQRIWLNDHEQLAGELGKSGTYAFLFGDAALGMEQFLGLAVNLGFEGAHRGLLEHFGRRTPAPGPRGGSWRPAPGPRLSRSSAWSSAWASADPSPRPCRSPKGPRAHTIEPRVLPQPARATMPFGGGWWVHATTSTPERKPSSARRRSTRRRCATAATILWARSAAVDGDATPTSPRQQPRQAPPTPPRRSISPRRAPDNAPFH